MTPIGSRVQTFGPQLMVLFEKVMEPLGGGALQKEGHHEGWALRFYSFR